MERKGNIASERIRRDGRHPPWWLPLRRLRSLSGTSCALNPEIAPHCSRFRGRSLRFESCRPKKNAPEWEHFFWVDRIRTCGMTAPKAVGLPLADDPKMP